METVKRRVFNPAPPQLEKDVDRYMEYKIHKYLDYLDSIDEGLYCMEYETDIPTKEELLNGVDQSNYVGGDGSYRLKVRLKEEEDIKVRLKEEEDNKMAEQKNCLIEEGLAEQSKQEEYEKTDKYKLEQIMHKKAMAKEDKLYWEEYDKQALKTSSNVMFEPAEPAEPAEPVNERRNGGMSIKLLRSALKEIAKDKEVQLLKELDEKYMGLECLPLNSFVKETRARELKEDAEVNSVKLAKLLKKEGGSMPADQYTHSLELLYQYINRVEHIDTLMGATYGDC